MNLTNKQITITALVATPFPNKKTTVTFSIYDQVSDTLQKFISEYTLVLNDIYISNPESTELMQLIMDQLLVI